MGLWQALTGKTLGASSLWVTFRISILAFLHGILSPEMVAKTWCSFSGTTSRKVRDVHLATWHVETTNEQKHVENKYYEKSLESKPWHPKELPKDYSWPRPGMLLPTVKSAWATHPFHGAMKVFIETIFRHMGGSSSSWGYPKFAGWLISWKIPSFEMDDDWGYPYDSGTFHIALKSIFQQKNVEWSCSTVLRHRYQSRWDAKF